MYETKYSNTSDIDLPDGVEGQNPWILATFYTLYKSGKCTCCFCPTHSHVLFWGHWYPCFGFLVTSPLGFKARVGSALFAFHEIHFWSYMLPTWFISPQDKGPFWFSYILLSR